MRILNSSAVLFALATIAGCATDGADGSAAGSGGGGGKGDDGSEQGLHVEAQVTKLGPQNEIRWPVAVDDASEVDNIINEALKFETVTMGEDLEAIKAAWAAAGPDDVVGGLVSADFTVDGNVRNVLSLTIQQEWLGAYIDFSKTYLNFNSNTGASVAITDILTEASLPVIASRLDEVLQQRIATLKTELAAEIASGEIEATQWDELHVTVADLSQFSTTNEGITFHYDAGFPHVIQALEPDGEFAVTIDQLDAAISSEGLWADEY